MKSELNRLLNVNEMAWTFGVEIGEDSITWGKDYDHIMIDEDPTHTHDNCLPVRQFGFFRRSNERFVLPYAVGCQLPTSIHNYSLILKA